jgi:hypothetical protein
VNKLRDFRRFRLVPDPAAETGVSRAYQGPEDREICPGSEMREFMIVRVLPVFHAVKDRNRDFYAVQA